MTKGEQTREKIFRIAVIEFAEHGYDGARVDRIARNSKVNKERIYAYFGNKENLFIEVWKHAYNLSAETDKEFLQLTDEDIPKLGEIILRNDMMFHERHPEFWKIFAWENLLKGKHKEHIKGLKQPVNTHLKKLYAKGQDQGLFKKDVTFETFRFVLISISFFFASNKSTMSETLRMDFQDPKIKEEYISECIRMLF